METTTLPHDFYCKYCDYNTSRSDNFTKHNLTRKHIEMQNRGLESQKVGKYTCMVCKFATNVQRDYNRHVATQKHKERVLKENEDSNANIIIECQKQLIDNQKMVFEYLEKKDQDNQKQILENQKMVFEYLEKKDKEIKELVIQLCSNQGQITNNTTTHTNSHNTNNTFNLQFFLNETCKNALNLSEFIQNVKVDIKDIERIGDVGYVNGLSEVIIRNLNALGTEKRPIHCTDAKRQTLYVKEDNKWEKENEDMKHMQMLVDEVQRANLRLLTKWREMHPDCLASTSIYCDDYLNISQELMGGDCSKMNMTQKDNKIMNKVAKEVTIDKIS